MAHYRRLGEVPPKRHTQHRDPEGRLYYEELMGEEGFSSDSSLLYHRGVPSAIVGSEVWELPDQSRRVLLEAAGRPLGSDRPFFVRSAEPHYFLKWEFLDRPPANFNGAGYLKPFSS